MSDPMPDTAHDSSRPSAPERLPLSQLPGGSRGDDPPLTVREFAQWCGVSPGRIRRAIREGQLQALNLADKNGKPNYRLELRDCIAFLKARGYNTDRVAILERLVARRATSL